MLKIATPVSHLFEDKLQAKKIIKYSDCLEIRERNLHLKFNREYLFHVDKDITLRWDKKFKFSFLNILKKKKFLKLITFQSTRCCHNEKLIEGMFQLSGKVYTKKQMLLHAKKNINWLKKKINPKIKIGLENNNYYNAPAYEIITEGNFISEIVIKNKIFFLLDIAHAAITSFNKKIKFQKYLNSLPLHKTIQLHIVDYKIKKILNKKIAIDTHNFPTNRTYKLVSQLLLKYPSIEYLTIEYYKNADRLVKSIKKLKKILKQ